MLRDFAREVDFWGKSYEPMDHPFITSALFGLILPTRLGKALGRSLGHFWEKKGKNHSMALLQCIKRRHLAKKILNSMQGLKSAILAIFQRGPQWPCPVSTALKNPYHDDFLTLP